MPIYVLKEEGAGTVFNARMQANDEMALKELSRLVGRPLTYRGEGEPPYRLTRRHQQTQGDGGVWENSGIAVYVDHSQHKGTK
jgi:hypothetical protein